MSYKNKSIILVDHNEFSQSVPYIERATVLEVIDHHRIYDFYSKEPILFRNEIVGSSSTIIASLFKEKNVNIPKKLAGLMLGAIISDTLNFQSPTTTQKDLDMAEMLEEISQLNMDEFAYDILFINSESETKSVSDFLKEDVKSFDIEGYKVIIAQAVIPSFERLNIIKESIHDELIRYVRKKNCDLVCLVFTSIAENGSYFYNEGKIAEWIENEFPLVNGQPPYMEKIISRKKQIVPIITQIIQKNV